MTPPPSFSLQGEKLDCQLHKSLYSLKQASRNLFSKLTSVLLDAGFTQSQADHSLFTLTTHTTITTILVYVEDIPVVGNDLSQIEAFKTVVSTHFESKDLGPLKYFLGIEVAHFPKGCQPTKICL